MTPTDAISIAHGVPTVYAEYGDLIRAAPPIEVGTVGRGAPDTLVHRRIDPRGLYTGQTDRHDTTAVKHLKRFGGDKFLIVEAINGTPNNDPGHFETLNRLGDMIREGVPVITEPFYAASLLGMQGIGSLKYFLDGGNTLYACEYHTYNSQPASLCTLDDPRPWPHTIVGFEERNGPYNHDLAGVVVETGAASWAGPILASGCALLRLIAPSIPAAEIIRVVIETAPIVNNKRFLRVDLAARELLGARSVPVPAPEPQPEPAPQPDPEPKPQPTYPRTLADGEGVEFSDKTILTVELPNGGRIVGDGITILQEVRTS